MYHENEFQTRHQHVSLFGRHLRTHWNCQNLSLEQWSLGGAMFNPEQLCFHGKNMGKPWENHGKTMGKHR